jgi:hypothetical protein
MINQFTNQQIKEAAQSWYNSISRNEIESIELSSKFEGFFRAEVRIPNQEKLGEIFIGFNVDHDEMTLCTKVGRNGLACHSMTSITKWTK